MSKPVLLERIRSCSSSDCFHSSRDSPAAELSSDTSLMRSSGLSTGVLASRGHSARILSPLTAQVRRPSRRRNLCRMPFASLRVNLAPVPVFSHIGMRSSEPKD
eukprot:scaffold565742_cov47-Prasinocladus_malaysianus.AAC.1